jgi:hypothetical protein
MSNKSVIRQGMSCQFDYPCAGLIGDGGTADIGFQGLSGAAERNENVFWFTYDNEAYMNTGIQRSGGTPYTAATTTSPAGRKIPGKPEFKKDFIGICAAHGIEYAFIGSEWFLFRTDIYLGIAEIKAGDDCSHVGKNNIINRLVLITGSLKE